MTFWGSSLRYWFAVEVEDEHETSKNEVEHKGKDDANEDCGAQEIPECL